MRERSAESDRRSIVLKIVSYTIRGESSSVGSGIGIRETTRSGRDAAILSMTLAGINVWVGKENGQVVYRHYPEY